MGKAPQPPAICAILLLRRLRFFQGHVVRFAPLRRIPLLSRKGRHSRCPRCASPANNCTAGLEDLPRASFHPHRCRCGHPRVLKLLPANRPFYSRVRKATSRSRGCCSSAAPRPRPGGMRVLVVSEHRTVNEVARRQLITSPENDAVWELRIECSLLFFSYCANTRTISVIWLAKLRM